AWILQWPAKSELTTNSLLNPQVVNDDGPPSKKLSPYVRPFVDALQDAGHRVSVAVPAESRSWIGKAHIIGASLKASYVHPDSFREDGTWDSSVNNHEVSQNASEAKEDNQQQQAPVRSRDNDWVVVSNGTPASCTQLGIYNLFTDRGPIDLVVSGPNHGRNASTIYNLSSGTVGGALEAATCGKRGIALSFGSKEEQDPEVIKAASRLSVRLIEHLYRNWDERVELYNLNVPMRADVESRPIRYTRALPNRWTKGSLYAEVTHDDGEAEHAGDGNNNNLNNGAAKVASKSGLFSWFTNGATATHVDQGSTGRERYFQWSTELSDIKRSLEASEEGTDAHTVLSGCTR
ncbi:Acid phosphatase, partial [Rasamsonia emersonii CBS 393.64]